MVREYIEVSEYLLKKGFTWTVKERPSGQEAIFNCPFCGDTEKKFSINLKSGAFRCLHENKCGVSGSFFDFQRKLGDDPKFAISENNFIKQPVSYKRPSVKPKRANEAREYLKSRGLTDETIDFFKVGQTEDGEAIMFPAFKNGELVDVKYCKIKRDGDKKKMWNEKNAEPCLFNRDNIPKDSEILTVCEGHIDCMSLWQMEIKSVSVPNGTNDLRWIENEWEWLARFKTIYLCLDNDNAGRAAIMNILNKLGSWRCRIVTLPYKDANDCLTNGVDLTDLITCFDCASEISPTLLTTAGSFEDEIVELFNDPEKRHGMKTFLPSLDRLLRGWRMGETTLWSGRNRSGKSTALNQCLLHLARENGVRSCIASLELPARRYLSWATIQHVGSEYPSSDEIRRAVRWMNQYIYVVNSSTSIEPKELLDVFEYAARRYDVKHFVIDSLMKVRFPNISTLTEQDEFVSSISDFGKKNNVHMHLVAHPRKGESDKVKPGVVDIAGSGHIGDLADNIIMLWRPDEEDKDALRKRNKLVSDAILYVKKNREFGDEGGVRLFFDSRTKTFREEE